MQFQQVKVYKALKSQRSSPAAVAVQVLFFAPTSTSTSSSDAGNHKALDAKRWRRWWRCRISLGGGKAAAAGKAGGKPREMRGRGGAPNEDRTWLANLLCKRKYGISLPRQCRRRSNRNSFQPAGKKSRTKDSRFSVRDAKVFL